MAFSSSCAYNIKVLVVDDARADRMIVGRILEMCGTKKNTIFYADSGIMAVQVAEVNMFDIVFLDIHMPIMDGITVAQLLRKRHPKVKLVGVSADEPSSDCPFDAYVQKPFNRMQFNSILSRFFVSDTDPSSIGSSF